MSTIATMLQFDWDEVDGELIAAVVAKGARGLSDGSLSCDEVAFVLGERAVVLRVNDDTDEVIVSLESIKAEASDWKPLDQIGEIVSHRIGWCWIGRNYLGYLDMFTIAVDGLDPAYSFIGIASTLQCTRIVSVTA